MTGKCQVTLENGESILPNDAVKVMKCDSHGKCIDNSGGAFLNFHQYIFQRGKVDDYEVHNTICIIYHRITHDKPFALF